MLATSNGHTGMDAKDELGSTSKGSFSGGGVGMMDRLSLRTVVVVVVVGLMGYMMV